ncbi:MAG: DUF58 domain-containing protein [Phycisphaerales bacterium]|nr:DUF58 domain-containing protein [Phycisphaerales bacterium]
MTTDAPTPPAAPVQRRYHFHWPGVTYVIVTLFLAVGALNSQNNLLFATLGVAMGGLLVSGIISGWSLMGLRLERDVSTAGTVGSPMQVRYVLHNVNRLMPSMALNIEEVRPRRGTGGWWEYFDTPRAFVAFIGPRGRARARATVTPLRRGCPPLRYVRVWSTFPFGLAKKSMWFEIPQGALVYPADLRLRPEFLRSLSAQSRLGSGEEPSPGHGDEFYGLREYAAGDNPRRIAWKPSARTGTLVIRQHAAPAPVRLWVVLRLGSRAHAGLDEVSIALAASVLRQAEHQAVAVGLAVPLTGAVHAPRRDRRHVARMLEDLARLDLAALAESRATGAEAFPAAARRGASIVIDADSDTPPRWGGGSRVAVKQVRSVVLDAPENSRLLALLAGGAA